jgi:hypothetical protein
MSRTRRNIIFYHNRHPQYVSNYKVHEKWVEELLDYDYTPRNRDYFFNTFVSNRDSNHPYNELKIKRGGIFLNRK